MNQEIENLEKKDLALKQELDLLNEKLKISKHKMETFRLLKIVMILSQIGNRTCRRNDYRLQ